MILDSGPRVERRRLGTEALKKILEVTRKLAAPFDLATMLTEVVQAAKQVLKADGGTLWLYEPASHELLMRVATGIEPVRVPADRGIVGECVRTRAIINVPDCYADERFNREVDRRTGYLTRCMLTLPLVGHDDALVGVLQLLNKAEGVFDAQDEEVAAALAAQCAVALQRVQMTEALVAGERLKQEIAVARQVQMSSLPREMPTLAGYAVTGSFRPADETGGDTFDLVALPQERLFVMVADATGHGIGPALSVTQMQAMLRLALRLGTSLEEAYRHVNNQLADDLPPERFVTACFGVLDARSHTFEFHAPGQGPTLHLRAATGAIERCLPTGPPLGTFPIGQARAPRRLQLEPGDVVGLISDGIFEWPNGQGEEFGFERVEALLRHNHRMGAGELAALIYRQAAAFAGGAQADDVTIVLLQRLAVADRTVLGEREVLLGRELGQLGVAVAAVQAFWNEHRLPEADRYAVDFAIEELFTNMVKYGRAVQVPVRLRLVREPGAVAVQLVDPDSERFDPTVDRKVDVAAPAAARVPGGLGLHLVARMLEDFAYEYVGRESRISFRKRTEA